MQQIYYVDPESRTVVASHELQRDAYEGAYPGTIRVELPAEPETITEQHVEEWRALEAQRLKPLEPWRFAAAIELAGLTTAIESAIAGLSREQQVVVRARLARATTYNRTDPLFDQLAGAVGLTSAEVDELWRQAQNL